MDEIVVATDFDREGELIGLEAVRIVREASPSATVRRARFSALTRPELLASFNELGDLDERLASSAATREVVDLAWGAVLTRFLSLACERRGRDLLSVGRVQTPTLALLEEREREIEESVPTPFWRVVATFARDGHEFRGEHAQSPFARRDEAEAARGLMHLGPGDELISYLPLSHIAEQMASLHGPAVNGYCVSCCEQMEQLPEALREVRPTIFLGVPRVWEKIQARVEGRVAQAPPHRQKLFRWAQRSALARARGERPLLHALAEALVGRKLRMALGFDRARLLVTAAAPIARATLEFFESLARASAPGPRPATRRPGGASSPSARRCLGPRCGSTGTARS